MIVLTANGYSHNYCEVIQFLGPLLNAAEGTELLRNICESI